MAHPKRKTSVTRRNKRRTHKNTVAVKNYSICPTTGEAHLPHRAYWYENKLYYGGKVVLDRGSIDDN